MVLIYLLEDTPRQAAIERLHRALSAGALHSEIGEVFDFADFSAAHDAVQTGTRTGAVLLRTGPES
jgi:NADPH2:quinone reductase